MRMILYFLGMMFVRGVDLDEEQNEEHANGLLYLAARFAPFDKHAVKPQHKHGWMGDSHCQKILYHCVLSLARLSIYIRIETYVERLRNLPRRDLKVSIGPISLETRASLSNKTCQYGDLRPVLPTGRSETFYRAEPRGEPRGMRRGKRVPVAENHALPIFRPQSSGMDILMFRLAPSAVSESLPH